MDRLLNEVIDRTRSHLDLRKLTTIFGRKHRPHHRRNGRPPRFEATTERLTYSLTIFKLRFGNLGVKIYTKGERVLRIEATAHAIGDLRCRKSIEHFPTHVQLLEQILERFLEVLQCVNVAWINDSTLEDLTTPSELSNTRVGGIDINQPRMRAVLQAVLALAYSPRGFTGRELAAKVTDITGQEFRLRQAAYDLRKLRGKNLAVRIGTSRRYETTLLGIRSIVALVLLREKVIRPLLANDGKRKNGRKPKNPHPLDARYEALQREVQLLFGCNRSPAPLQR